MVAVEAPGPGTLQDQDQDLQDHDEEWRQDGADSSVMAEVWNWMGDKRKGSRSTLYQLSETFQFIVSVHPISRVFMI